MRIREIQFNDNSQIESVIKSIFIELRLPLTGTVYEDVETTQMFESYQEDKGCLFCNRTRRSSQRRCRNQSPYRPKIVYLRTSKNVYSRRC